ncbi:MAG: hypothetical protein ACTHJV_09750 [Rhizobiaceae bacterium]
MYCFFHHGMRCKTDVAATLAKLACYRGHLPTGSPLSPIMAFYAHYDVWESIAAHCKANGYRLTVYIDDVTISGAALAPEVLWNIKRAIHRAGLRYHKEKRFIDRPEEITGVIVDGDRLIPPNRQLKKLHETRRALKRRMSIGVEKKLRERLTGLEGQVAQIGLVTVRSYSAAPSRTPATSRLHAASVPQSGNPRVTTAL